MTAPANVKIPLQKMDDSLSQFSKELEMESSEESCSSDSDEYERVVRLDPRKNRMTS